MEFRRVLFRSTPADVEQWLKPARANLPLPSLIVMPPQWARFLGCGPDYIERSSVVESTILHDVADRNGVADVFQRILLQLHQAKQLTLRPTANVTSISHRRAENGAGKEVYETWSLWRSEDQEKK